MVEVIQYKIYKTDY